MKYKLDLCAKDDLLLSKNFLHIQKIKLNLSNIFYKIKTREYYPVSNRSNTTVFLIILAFFFFFFSCFNFSLVYGTHKRILLAQGNITIKDSMLFWSNFYYFNTAQELINYTEARVNKGCHTLFLFFRLVYLKAFLILYLDDESFLDIVEENYNILITNFK